MKIIVVKHNQSLRDIALQYYGTMEAMGEILTLNSTILINDKKALVAIGVDQVNDKAFYLDVAIEEGLNLIVDNENRIINKMVIKELPIQTKYTL